MHNNVNALINDDCKLTDVFEEEVLDIIAGCSVFKQPFEIEIDFSNLTIRDLIEWASKPIIIKVQNGQVRPRIEKGLAMDEAIKDSPSFDKNKGLIFRQPKPVQKKSVRSKKSQLKSMDKLLTMSIKELQQLKKEFPDYSETVDKIIDLKS